MPDPCIFCQIIAGALPSHPVWENAKHLAFLSIFPNTPGFTVLVPRKHYPSDAMHLPNRALTDLVLAAKEVNAKLVRAFDDVGRCAVVMEGFGVDHVHVKLIPLHGTRMDEWQPIVSGSTIWKPYYDGYIDTRDGRPVADHHLAALAEKIRST